MARVAKTRSVEVGARRSAGIERSFARGHRSAPQFRPPDRYQASPTKPWPWNVRARNRRRNVIARASRKANR